MQEVKIGGSLTDLGITFSHNAKYLLTSSENDIKIWNAKTGTLANSILNSHEKRVTCLVLNPLNTFQVYSGSTDGFVKLWDYIDGSLLKTWKMANPVHFMKLSMRNPKEMFVLGADQNLDKMTSRITKLNLKKGSTVIVAKARECYSFDLSKCGKWIVFSSKTKLFWIDLDSIEVPIKKKKGKNKVAIGNKEIEEQPKKQKGAEVRSHSHNRLITKVLVSPTGEYILFSDVSGRIFQFYCFPTKEQRDLETPHIAEHHWHAHEVSDLAFSLDGSYFLSGGEESVLVFWHAKTNVHKYLPRLGVSICSIGVSLDETKYFVGMKNNSIAIVDASEFQVETYIKGLVFMQVKSEEPLDVFQVDSKFNSLVLNGIPGQIQFFDYKHGLSLSEFEIAIQNHISGMNEEKPIFFKVKLVKFSKDWMLTVERRVEFENKLKFWRFDQISQSYQLNTVINNPHEREINDVDLIQTNNESMAVSCGTDKNFKLWKLEGSQWKSVKTVNYHNFETSSVSFSSDGSVFAVAFDRFVTLWSSVGDNVHVFTSDSSRIINGLQFLNDSPLLVSYSYDRLIVWNLLTLAVHWGYKMKVRKVRASKNEKKFVVLADAKEKHKLLVFDGDSPIPTYLKDLPNPLKNICFTEENNLLMMTLKHELIHLSMNEDTKTANLKTEDAKSDPDFTSIIKDNFKKQEKKASKGLKTHKPSKQFNTIPTHILPPISSIFKVFIESALSSRAKPSEEIETENQVPQNEFHSKKESKKLTREEIQLIISNLI